MYIYILHFTVVSDIEFLDKELYKMIEEVIDEVHDRDFDIKYDF